MSDRRELDLLIELAKLVRKYGPEPFEALGTSLKSGETLKHLETIVAGMGSAARRVRREGQQYKTRRTASSIPKVPSPIKTGNNEKDEMLTRFRDDLIEGRLLPTVRDIKSFSENQKLAGLAATSRSKSIGPLIKSLAVLPTERIKAILRGVERREKGDRDLEGWSNIILQKGHSPGAKEDAARCPEGLRREGSRRIPKASSPGGLAD